MMNEFRCWIFAISDKTGNSQFHSTGNSQCGFRAGRIFQVKINALEFPVTSVRGHNFASESHYPKCPGGGGGGHSLIKVKGGGSDTDVFTRSGHSS